jgi:hypothetical protein
MIDVIKSIRPFGVCLFVFICTAMIFAYQFPISIVYGFGLLVGFLAADIWFN